MSFVLRGLKDGACAGLGTTSAPTFASLMVDARAAIARLSTIAHGLQIVAADLAQQNIADQAIAFTDNRAPRLLNEAQTSNDVARLLTVQKATAAIYKVVSPEVSDAIINRFLSGPVLALLPAAARESAKEEALEFVEKNINPLLKSTLGVVQIVGLLAGLFGTGYLVNAFRSRPRSNPYRGRKRL